MKDIIINDFQSLVDDLVARNKSLLDTLSKSQETNSRTNRAIAKAITHCGCIRLCAEKQHLPKDVDLSEMPNHLSTQIEGELCSKCRGIIETELGSNLFYLAALCNALDLDLYDVLIRESDRLQTLGKFHLR